MKQLLGLWAVLILGITLISQNGSQAISSERCCNSTNSTNNSLLFDGVCPVYTYLNYGNGVCFYYAMTCPGGTPCGLIHECGKWGDCNNTDECVAFSGFSIQTREVAKGSLKNHVSDHAKKGVKLRPNFVADPKPATEGRARTISATKATLVVNPKSGATAKVQLHLSLILPKNTIMSGGAEIDPGESTDLWIDYDQVEFAKGKYCVVRVGEVRYHVVLHQDTPLMEKD